MAEEIGKIISKGIETYSNNLNLCIPFVLNFFITVVVAVIMFAIGFVYIFGVSLSSLEYISAPEQFISVILPLVMKHIFEIAAIFLMIILTTFFIQSFFISGAIGMARQATESGKAHFSTMMETGKKNAVNLFLAEILFLLLVLAGIVFIVPGIKAVDFDQPSAIAGLLLKAGFLLWMVYLLIISLVLVAFRYALVIGSLDPVEGILAGIDFFKKNTFDVIILTLVILGVAFVFAIIDMVMNFIPVLNIIWSFVSFLIPLCILSPVMTVWWVRLYMTRTDKQVYVNDLLAHPDDLP
jgi:hypothetical protein